MTSFTEAILKIKIIIKRIINTDCLPSIRLIFLNNVVLCNWYEHPEGNFGDDLNPWMLEKTTG